MLYYECIPKAVGVLAYYSLPGTSTVLITSDGANGKLSYILCTAPFSFEQFYYILLN